MVENQNGSASPRTRRLPLLAAAALGFAGSIALSGDAWAESFSRKEKECRTGRGQIAIASCNWLLRSGKIAKGQRHLVYLFRGYRHFDMAAYRDALVDFNKALSEKPGYGAAHYSRALTLVRMGENSMAIADFDKAIRFEPDLAAYYLSRGATRLELEQYEGAVADFRKTLQLEPGNATAAKLKGRAEAKLAIAKIKKGGKVKSKRLTEHCVTGIAANETLKLRRRPGATERKSGEIGPGSCGVMVDLKRCRNSWCFALHRGSFGWLEARYVRRR